MPLTPIQKIRNLVFQGGSVRGVAYVGALTALEAAGIEWTQIKRVAGTSAGAITALLVSLDYSISQIQDLLSNISFEDYLDDAKVPTRDKVLKSAAKIPNHAFVTAKIPAKTLAPVLLHRLSNSFGIYEGQFFLDWIQQCILEKTSDKNLTFKELHELVLQHPGRFKDLYVMGTNLSTAYCQEFSWEKTPHACIAHAVRISMSIPGIFKPHCIHFKNSANEIVIDSRNHVYVDGGVMDNYPIFLFDHAKYLEDGSAQAQSSIFNHETLGFRLLY
jgi:NTE family protein